MEERLESLLENRGIASVACQAMVLEDSDHFCFQAAGLLPWNASLL